MFQFPRFAPLKLCVHLRVPQHYLRWVAPFGYLRVNACLRLTVAFRRLPRPSSAPGAKASALRPYYLDLSSCSYSNFSFRVTFRAVQFSRCKIYKTKQCGIKALKSLFELLHLELLRKEVIQPHLPIRLPCYDFTPVIGFTFGS